MNHDRADGSSRRLLVYFPIQRGATLIREILGPEGLEVTGARNPIELEAALRSGGYRAVITFAPLIGQVRSLSDLPIINVQAFILAQENASANGQSTVFDRPAFLARVRSHNADDCASVIPDEKKPFPQPDLIYLNRT